MTRRSTKSDITAFLLLFILIISFVVVATIISFITQVIKVIINNWQTVIPILTFISLLFLLIKKNIKDDKVRKEKVKQELLFSQHKAMSYSQIDSMNGLEFEHYAAKLMQNEGYSSKVTVASNDMGVDIIASKDLNKYSVQVKRQKSKVSRRAVSDAVAGMNLYGCNRSMVVTNNYFTPGAIKLAKINSCILIDRDRLIKWNHNFKNRATFQESPKKQSKNIKNLFSSAYFKENKYYLIALIIVGLVIISNVIWPFNGFFNNNSEHNKSNNSTTIIDYEKTFDNSWRMPHDSEFTTIGKLMVKNNITGCGEYYVRVIKKNEYAIACTSNGTNWTYYIAWPKNGKIILANANYAMDNSLKPPS